MIDIKLNEDWQLTSHTNGDILTISDKECLLQDIRLEAVTSEGDLFYDTSYGFGLMEFMHQPHGELLKIEIQQRLKQKLRRRTEIDISSIKTTVNFMDDSIEVYIEFRLLGDDETLTLNLSVSPVRIEVINID